jgi:Protein of unknown function (DUF3251)
MGWSEINWKTVAVCVGVSWLTTVIINDTPNNRIIKGMSADIADIKWKTSGQKNEIDLVKNDLEKKDSDISLLQLDLAISKQQFGYFSASETGFDTMETGLGKVFVAIRDVKPYANGYKLTLDIGNPNFVTFGKVSGKVEWNKKDVYQWDKNRTKEFSLTSNLLAGRWNKTEVVIAPAEKQELENIRISIKAETVYLTP